MQDSPDMEAERPSGSGVSVLAQRAASSPGFEESECGRLMLWCEPAVAFESVLPAHQ